MKTTVNPAAGSNSRSHAGAKHARFPHHPAILQPLDGQAETDHPFAEGARDEVDPDLRQRLISNAAFELYAQRGFVDGHDVDDWLCAEARIDHLISGAERTSDV